MEHKKQREQGATRVSKKFAKMVITLPTLPTLNNKKKTNLHFMLTIPCKTHKEQKNKQTKRWVKLVGKIENVGKVDIPTNQYINLCHTKNQRFSVYVI